MLKTIIFSKDRPMQLDLLLRSLPALSSPPIVIYRGDDTIYNAFADRCTLLKEHNFYDDTMRVFRSTREPFTMMLTDDTVFLQRPDMPSACAILADHPKALVFSLRLGDNTTWCYMLGVAQVAAGMVYHGPAVREWPIALASGDFAYPFDLSSSIYRTSDLVRWANTLGRFRNPNELEATLSKTPISADATMVSFARSVAVSVPMNVTQELWANKHSGTHATSVQTLLSRWKDGWRFELPTSKLKTSSAHECIQLNQIRR
jgi:hypothetical protein